MHRIALKRSLATAAAVAATVLAAAAPAGAQDRDPLGFVVDGPYSVHQSGVPAPTSGFTPPIGSDKGSFLEPGRVPAAGSALRHR